MMMSTVHGFKVPHFIAMAKALQPFTYEAYERAATSMCRDVDTRYIYLMIVKVFAIYRRESPPLEFACRDDHRRWLRLFYADTHASSHTYAELCRRLKKSSPFASAFKLADMDAKRLFLILPASSSGLY